MALPHAPRPVPQPQAKGTRDGNKGTKGQGTDDGRGGQVLSGRGGGEGVVELLLLLLLSY